MNISQELNEHKLELVTSITYDAVGKVFYFVNSYPTRGIYSIKVKESSFSVSKVLSLSYEDEVEDVVYDFKEKAFYWIELNNDAIFKLKIDGDGTKEKFVHGLGSSVEDLEIDTCERNLFFIKAHSPKINLVSLTSATRRVNEIDFDNHGQPVALAIDHYSKRLYIADFQNTSSAYYTIDSTRTDGTNYRREIESGRRGPRNIAVDNDSVYYVEARNFELKRFAKKFDSNILKKFQTISGTKLKGNPFNVIVRSNFKTNC